MSSERHSPLIWIPPLCVAEEIPTAVVTFVSLLMFLQFGVDYVWASCLNALLLLPSVLKSYMRSKLAKAGHFKRHIHQTELLLFCVLMTIALCLKYRGFSVWTVFGLLFLVAWLCAIHDLLGQMYYNRMLYPLQQKFYRQTKIFASQATLVVTYGVLIIFAGFLEIFFRSVRTAWAMESYLVAGAFLVFAVINILTMQNPRVYNPYRYESLLGAFRHELRIVERIRRKPFVVQTVAVYALMLLPQSLLFNTRVFFLLADVTEGGLGCSIQEVGFAQGTVGVIAFSAGLFVGRMLYRTRRGIWPFVVPLTLSPVFYLLMSLHPLRGNMAALCCMTFLTQLCFGFGLNICLPIVQYISGERYRNTIDYLHIPLTALVMLLPMFLSGWLADRLGFRDFFIFTTCTAPASWIALWQSRLPRLFSRTETSSTHSPQTAWNSSPSSCNKQTQTTQI